MASTIEATSKVYKNVRSYFSAGHGVENYNLVSVRQKLTETYLYRVNGTAQDNWEVCSVDMLE